MIVGLHHIAIGVNDLEFAVDFYTSAFGFEVAQSNDFDRMELVDRAVGLEDVKAKMVMLKAPNTYIELWQYSNPVPRDLRAKPADHGYQHISLQVEDIEAEYERLQDQGMTFVDEVVRFSDSAAVIYGKDPFGNIIELYEIKSSSLPRLDKHS